jgi:hypothetical protein
VTVELIQCREGSETPRKGLFGVVDVKVGELLTEFRPHIVYFGRQAVLFSRFLRVASGIAIRETDWRKMERTT